MAADLRVKLRELVVSSLLSSVCEMSEMRKDPVAWGWAWACEMREDPACHCPSPGPEYG